MSNRRPRIIAELDTGWQADAACRDTDPALFFDPDNVVDAVHVCATCPVVAACDAYADRINAPVGVFAGRDRAEDCRKPHAASYWRRVRHEG